ncbi:hypothetical protein DA717_12040 [Piscirickettsiaceae bacterium NZ-RLO2]|uniref:hypothetical protein n=1 Tax=Piscirickettsia salmonis TaxID=1238 RepID=UPI000F093263|nr:hypothetical protein DA717_12040 [Piscirickettsiaceae bacterium NZ-RLO2]
MIKISPTTALLLVLKKKPEKNKKISELLFNGRNDKNGDEFDTLLNSVFSLYSGSNYEIVTEPQFISDDPVRRYFETQFAYHFINENLPNIDEEKLKNLIEQNLSYLKDKKNFSDFSKKFLNEEDFNVQIKSNIDKILSGVNGKIGNTSYAEYADAISNIKSNKNCGDFSPKDREKLENLIKLAFLSVRVTVYHNSLLPINIYNQGFYRDRGRDNKSDQEKVISQNIGLMKSYHPLVESDPNFRDSPTNFTRAADGASFNLSSYWVESNFSRLVNPFSNSISGTMLAQLRVLADLSSKGQLDFQKGELFKYLHLFASTLLFYLGGHSYHEFLYPLKIYEVKDTFISLEPKIYNYEISNILGNARSINQKVLDSTLEYFEKIELKSRLHNELICKKFHKELSLLKIFDIDFNKHYSFLEWGDNAEKILDRLECFAENYKALEQFQMNQDRNLQKILDHHLLFNENYKYISAAQLLQSKYIKKILDDPKLIAENFTKLSDANLVNPENIKKMFTCPNQFGEACKELAMARLLLPKHIITVLNDPWRYYDQKHKMLAELIDDFCNRAGNPMSEKDSIKLLKLQSLYEKEASLTVDEIKEVTDENNYQQKQDSSSLLMFHSSSIKTANSKMKDSFRGTVAKNLDLSRV